MNIHPFWDATALSPHHFRLRAACQKHTKSGFVNLRNQFGSREGMGCTELKGCPSEPCYDSFRNRNGSVMRRVPSSIMHSEGFIDQLIYRDFIYQNRHIWCRSVHTNIGSAPRWRRMGRQVAARERASLEANGVGSRVTGLVGGKSHGWAVVGSGPQ